jgi:mannose-6-phosphate isomerase-like protein (cupin superfamily)
MQSSGSTTNQIRLFAVRPCGMARRSFPLRPTECRFRSRSHDAYDATYEFFLYSSNRARDLLSTIMIRLVITALLLGTASLPALAADPMSGVTMPLDALRFAPDDDVKCLSSALETGDPAKGPSTFALKAPPGCVVPWHFHTAEEQAIVIRGQVKMEMAAHASMQLGPGGFAMMRGKAPHQFACVGKTPCLIIVMFDGVYDIFWGRGK